MIVHYCHPNCKPFMNICRLPKEEAFSLASAMAADNPETTAFWRFADFENYYPLRMSQDEYLLELFLSLGGSPKERHPLSFVLQGSEFLDNWFGNGPVFKIKLKDVPSEYISFTLGDSGAAAKKNGATANGLQRGNLTMYTKEILLTAINDFNGAIDDFLSETAKKYTYIEAQLWNDDYIV